ncbi:hypothetical protein ACIOGT_12610 [Streptomyces microflavus]|uniref:Uncharacterized protein n=1 Tax=Streptomyces microflavus DSM 40593 TaxID=1303692 RepID=N0D348_STRMI|nr:hypothetical protein [Streptomyces microflavus]AGK81594.1 hypothetical protein SFUL_6716 [Streptomyces microflavus DSM 40593]
MPTTTRPTAPPTASAPAASPARSARSAPAVRVGKGFFVTVVAVALSHVILSDGLFVSLVGQAATNMGAGPGYSSDVSFTSAVVNTTLTMALVLWVGMRLLRERRVYVMVLVGAVGWFLTVMANVDALLERAYGLLPLAPMALFVLVTALTAGLLRPVRR